MGKKHLHFLLKERLNFSLFDIAFSGSGLMRTLIQASHGWPHSLTHSSPLKTMIWGPGFVEVTSSYKTQGTGQNLLIVDLRLLSLKPFEKLIAKKTILQSSDYCFVFLIDLLTMVLDCHLQGTLSFYCLLELPVISLFAFIVNHIKNEGGTMS